MEASTAPTTPPTAPEAATEAPPGSGADPGNGPAPEAATGDRERGEDGRLLSREAANYRRQLRETQAERDGLREQLDSLQRVEVERLAAQSGLAVASDVWLHGATLDTLRDDTGAIDAETVIGVVDAIVKDRPGLQARPVGDIGIGKGAAAADRRMGPKVGLSALLKPGRS